MSALCHCLWLRCFIDGCLTFTVSDGRRLFLIFFSCEAFICIPNISKHYSYSVYGALKLEACAPRFWVAPQRQEPNVYTAAISLALTLVWPSNKRWHFHFHLQRSLTQYWFRGRAAISRYAARCQNFFFFFLSYCQVVLKLSVFECEPQIKYPVGDS